MRKINYEKSFILLELTNRTDRETDFLNAAGIGKENVTSINS